MAIQQVMVTPSVTHRVGGGSYRTSNEILTLAESFQVPARNNFNRVQRWVKSLPEGRLDPDLLLSERARCVHQSFGTLHDIIEGTAVLQHVMQRDFPKDADRQQGMVSLLSSQRKKLRKCRLALTSVAERCIPSSFHAIVDEIVANIQELGVRTECLYLAVPSDTGLDFYVYIACQTKRKRYLMVTLSNGIPHVNYLSRYTPPNRVLRGLATTFNNLWPLCNQLLKEDIT